MESVIKWQTGVPTTKGRYLVTVKYHYITNLNTREKTYSTIIGETYWDDF